MTNTYRIASRIAKEIVNVHNAKYEALRERDSKTFEKLRILEKELRESLESFGYEISLVCDTRELGIFGFGSPFVFKVIGANISRVEEEV